MGSPRKNKKGSKKNQPVKVLMILSNPLLVDPRVHKEAKALIQAGYKVTVIVWDRYAEYDPYDTIDDITIIRIHNTTLMKWLPTVFLRQWLWWRRAYKKALELSRKGFDFSIVHCHDLDTLKVGMWLKKKRGIKLIYDAHEIFGYMLKDTHPTAASYAFRMENKLVHYVDHIITIDEPFKKYYTRFNKPVTIVMNCKDLIYPEYTPPANKTFTLIYIGLMIQSRFFPEILEVIGELDGVKLILAGKKEALYDEMKQLSQQYKNVEFLGTIPTKDILSLTKKADATFVIAELQGQLHLNVFNKQFEAMVCGRPILVTKGTYAAEMTEKLKCGLTVDYTKESVTNAIQKLQGNPSLCEELGKNAFKAAQEKYNWEMEKNHLLHVYEEIQ